MADTKAKDEKKVSLSDLNDDPSLYDSLSLVDVERLIEDFGNAEAGFSLAGNGTQTLWSKHAELSADDGD